MSLHGIGMPLVVSAFILMAAPALAQISPNDGPLVAPLQPEPTIGLPEQAPEPRAQPDLPQPTAPAARPTQSDRPAAQPAGKAAAPSSGSAWQLECVEQESQPRACQAILRSRVNEQVAMVVAIAKVPASGDVRLQMALPLGIDMRRGAVVAVGDFTETLALSRCTAQGCLVETTASPALIAGLSEGKAGSVKVHAPDGQVIELPLTSDAASSVLAEAGLDG